MRRKDAGLKNNSSVPTKKQRTIDLGWNNDDENIDSDEEQDEYLEPSLNDEEVEEEETLDSKKIRLAREYLNRLEAGDSDDTSSSSSEDESETEYDRIGVKLQRDRLKREGVLETVVADKVDTSLLQFRESLASVDSGAKAWIEAGRVKLLRGHDLTPTCVALKSDGEKALSGSKDHSVIFWDVEEEKKALTLCQSWKQDPSLSRGKGEVLAVACSDDGHYAAVGRRDSTVSIYDIRAGKRNLVKTFTGHKGPVTCLGFRTQSLQMFSGSDDRCIRYVFLMLYPTLCRN